MKFRSLEVIIVIPVILVKYGPVHLIDKNICQTILNFLHSNFGSSK